MTLQPNQTPVVRLKEDRLILKLGSESCELEVTDGLTDEAAHLVLTIKSRINEVLSKPRRTMIKEAKQIV